MCIYLDRARKVEETNAIMLDKFVIGSCYFQSSHLLKSGGDRIKCRHMGWKKTDSCNNCIQFPSVLLYEKITSRQCEFYPSLSFALFLRINTILSYHILYSQHEMKKLTGNMVCSLQSALSLLNFSPRACVFKCTEIKFCLCNFSRLFQTYSDSNYPARIITAWMEMFMARWCPDPNETEKMQRRI